MRFGDARIVRSSVIGMIFLMHAVFAAQLFAAPTKNATDNQSDPEALTILRKLDDLWRGNSSHGTIAMNIQTAHWSRSLEMEMWSKGTNKSLVKVLNPLKEKGTATLKNGSEAYNYLPQTDRTIKLTSAMMMASWLGSHFTNDDLVKDSRFSDDYISKVNFKGNRGGQDVVELVCIPKPEVAIVWGKLIIVVRKSDSEPLSIAYFDEDGAKKREMSFSDYRTVKGRLVPFRMKMVPMDKPGEFTELIYGSLELDIDIADQFFSINQLKR
jgi:hypothetical protein